MWCIDCKNKSIKGSINLKCLACKWQYVGQESFDKKNDYFEPVNEFATNPNDIYKKYGESLSNIV